MRTVPERAPRGAAPGAACLPELGVQVGGTVIAAWFLTSGGVPVLRQQPCAPGPVRFCRGRRPWGKVWSGTLAPPQCVLEPYWFVLCGHRPSGLRGKGPRDGMGLWRDTHGAVGGTGQQHWNGACCLGGDHAVRVICLTEPDDKTGQVWLNDAQLMCILHPGRRQPGPSSPVAPATRAAPGSLLAPS